MRNPCSPIVLAAVFIAAAAGCKPARVVSPRDAAPAQAHTVTPPPILSPTEILDFDPQPDPEAARLWRRLMAGERGTVRAELAARYEAQRYRAAAAFVRAAGEAEKGVPAERWLPELLQTDLGPGVIRGCDRYDSNVIRPILEQMFRLTTASRYLEARDAGLSGMQEVGRLCPLVVQTAFATIAAAAERKPVSDEEFELARRATITGDIGWTSL
ncbi:MAG TPA: hypothetical protein VGF28_17590 [Thermoanaerobaculia bacterium]|jgi:hypothetical protein